MSEALKEAIKEFFRVVVLAVIPILVDSLTTGEFQLRILFITGAIAGLRFIDSWLHEMGKEKENKTMEKGLTRF